MTAPAPERIAPKSIFADETIIDFIIRKYCDALPLYRQRAVLMRDLGIDVALTTINDAVLRVGELLIPVVDTMKHDLVTGGYIQADETHVDVQTPEKKGSTTAPSSGSTVRRQRRVFDFEMTRGKTVAAEFFKNYGGILHTDGYVVYENDIGTKDLIHACCLAHARRGFIDAIKVLTKAQAPDVRLERAVALMGRLVRDRPPGARAEPVARRSPCATSGARPRVARRVTYAAHCDASLRHNSAAVGCRQGHQLHAEALGGTDTVPQTSCHRTIDELGGKFNEANCYRKA